MNRQRLNLEPIEATLEIDAGSMDAALKEAEQQLEMIAAGRSWSVRTSVTPFIDNAMGAPLLWHFEVHCTSLT